MGPRPPSDATRALLGWGTQPGTWQQLRGRAAARGIALERLDTDRFCDLVYSLLADRADAADEHAASLGAEPEPDGLTRRKQLDMDLGVDRWPDATGLIVASWAAPAVGPATAERDPDVPDWWTGENTNQFLAEQGVVLG